MAQLPRNHGYTEYRAVDPGSDDVEALEERLNSLAREGWHVHTFNPKDGAVLLERAVPPQ